MQTHGSSSDAVHPIAAVEPSGFRLIESDTDNLSAERDRLVEFLRGPGSVLALWLTVCRLHAIAKILKGEDPNVEGKYEERTMKAFVDGLSKQTGVKGSTIYRYRQRAKKLVALIGQDAVESLRGTVVANDESFLMKLGTVKSKEAALEVLGVYVQGAGKAVASEMLDHAIYAQTVEGLKVAAAVGSTVFAPTTTETGEQRGVVLYGDVLARIADIPDNHVQVIVTSPPFYAVRDYGTRSWFGGDAASKHVPVTVEDNDVTCPTCGAWWGQLGLEPSVDLFIAHMVAVFRACRPKLRDDGVMFIEIDDSYAGSGRGPQGEGGKGNHSERQGFVSPGVTAPELPAKNLCLVPERLALALQVDGWLVRQRIVWHKTTGLGEPVEDRCSHSHSVAWMVTKCATYYFDHVAIMDDAVTRRPRGPGGPKCKSKTGHCDPKFNEDYNESTNMYGVTKRYARDVWSMAPGHFEGAHTATFPEELPQRCIEAASSPKACASCGTPYRRAVHWPEPVAPSDAVCKTRGDDSTAAGTRPSLAIDVLPAPVTLGFEPGCDCGIRETRPCVVCDPFCGTATTLAVAMKLGRDYVGIEVNETGYRPLIEQRLAEAKIEVEKQKDKAAGEVTKAIRRANSGNTEAPESESDRHVHA